MIVIPSHGLSGKSHSRTRVRCRSIQPPATPCMASGWPSDPARWLRDIAGFQAHNPCEFLQGWKMPTIHDLDTPSILIDAARAEANIARAQAHADKNGLKLRPHIKTHKLPYWAKKQVAAGAVGITCQKIGEAEVMADAGLGRYLSALQHSGRAKLDRLKALHAPGDAVGDGGQPRHA